jgi:hypothetical protein
VIRGIILSSAFIARDSLSPCSINISPLPEIKSLLNHDTALSSDMTFPEPRTNDILQETVAASRMLIKHASKAKIIIFLLTLSFLFLYIIASNHYDDMVRNIIWLY